MSRVIAICSQKGGVGKTSTAINLSAFLNHAGYRTLLIDLDPQANTTTGVSGESPKFDPLQLLLSDPTCWDEITVVTPERNLFLVPSHSLPDRKLDLTDLDQNLTFRIREELLKIRPRYDYVIIDTPPATGPIAHLALQISDSVLVPVQCEYFAMQAVSKIIPLIESIEMGSGRPPLEIEGFLLTMFDEDLDISYDVAAELEDLFPERILKTIIPRDVAIAEAASHGIPICEYDLRSRGAWAYLKLAKEIISHVRQSEEARTRSGLTHPPKRRARRESRS